MQAAEIARLMRADNLCGKCLFSQVWLTEHAHFSGAIVKIAEAAFS
ncbi:hypothetical protein CEV32_4538 [Brucella rhizosphaerae]|uniref:Uncharacterized protein n=1 Tax=Brucella rhizosphaerae TaxID=571254 RepID=A0A256FLV3_9HYPH|nr:hypothetical protein CEV32_4538 [Brucella rhizosphaerae]